MKLLNASGWKLIGDWEWINTKQGKYLQVEIERR